MGSVRGGIMLVSDCPCTWIFSCHLPELVAVTFVVHILRRKGKFAVCLSVFGFVLGYELIVSGLVLPLLLAS